MNKLAQKMGDAYREKLAEAGIIRSRTCKICGKRFIPKGNQKCCSWECSEENTRRNMREHNRAYSAAHRKQPPTMKCMRCGKEVPNAPGKKLCHECAVEVGREKARARSAQKRKLAALSRMPVDIGQIVDIVEIEPPPTVKEEQPTCYPKPGGWTGPIMKEPNRPVKARLRIPVNRLPDRGRPTKDRAYEAKTKEEIKKEIAQAEFGKYGLW